MMTNRIELKFDKATTKLAGNPYGRSVFDDQLRDKIDYSKKNIIIFPNNIERVASSFTQGMFSEIIKEIGYDKLNQIIKIEAGSGELEKRIYEDLVY